MLYCNYVYVKKLLFFSNSFKKLSPVQAIRAQYYTKNPDYYFSFVYIFTIASSLNHPYFTIKTLLLMIYASVMTHSSKKMLFQHFPTRDYAYNLTHNCNNNQSILVFSYLSRTRISTGKKKYFRIS